MLLLQRLQLWLTQPSPPPSPQHKFSFAALPFPEVYESLFAWRLGYGRVRVYSCLSLSLSLSLLYRIGPHCGRCVMKPSTSDLISHISSDGSLGLFAVIPCDPGPL
jgi:hypothetical protein